ncbi:MAG: cell division protein FtsW [Gemmatimonadales bacterium]|nr:MAG: cell division protein FtsW [Gemmatimonadales bacterium]
MTAATRTSTFGFRGFPVRPGSSKSLAGKSLVAITVLFVGFGLLSVYSASSFVAQNAGLQDSHYLFQQASRAGIGILVLIVASQVDYRLYRKLAWPILGLAVFLLIPLLLPWTHSIAPRVNGARRWLDLGLTIQPSELAKMAVVMWTAAIAVKKQEHLHEVREGLLPIGLVVGLVCLLVLFEPHFSAALWIAVLAGVVLFAAGARLTHFALVGLVTVPVVLLAAMSTEYRRERLRSYVATFFDPSSVAASSGYQLRQSMIAIGSGGVTGVGFGRSSLKMSYLPEPQNDFIFSIIAEEWGLIGAVALICLFVAWTLIGIQIARNAPDVHGRLLAVGMTSLVSLAAFAHMGVALGLLPTTGVNLPFISAGGTNLILMLGATGILLNVSTAWKR